jgi:hypothetical protein
MSQLYYLLRSRADGSYLVARPHGSGAPNQPTPTGFLLVFYRRLRCPQLPQRPRS